MAGPLRGMKVIEIAGIGPGPFCAMVLADMGAEVVRVDRAPSVRSGPPDERARFDLLARGRAQHLRRSQAAEGVDTCCVSCEQADGLFEGFRPGVMERLGLGPDVCLARNPRLVYGRMTGFGQDGRSRRPRVTTSTTSRSRACSRTSAARASRRCRRSI